MKDSDGHERILRLTVVGILAGFISLLSPWWSLILWIRGNLVASFNLFLWGVVQRGFQRAALSFEWWSYLTFVIVLIGSFLGLVGYVFAGRGNVTWKRLIGLQDVLSFAGCLFYLTGMLFTFAAYNTDPEGIVHWWIVGPTEMSGTTLIGGLQPFNMIHVQSMAAVLLQFLNAGFWFALISGVIPSFTLYKLRKTKTPQADSPSC
jgi:hypothetical protein